MLVFTVSNLQQSISRFRVSEGHKSTDSHKIDLGTF